MMKRLFSTNPLLNLRNQVLPIVEWKEFTEEGWKEIYSKQQPVVLRGIANTWPAISSPQRKWSDLKLLKERIDKSTLVPLEIGENYMDPNLRQPSVQLESFLDYVINGIENKLPSSQELPKIYLAQFNIHEIPIMRDDIIIPDICLTTGKKHQYRQNIWFGTHTGTSSPCHTDPFQNMLIQVIGEKDVIIIDPTFSSQLYPALGTSQKNTSLVNFLTPDYVTHLLFAEVPCHHTILRPGDGIFIPYRWWHYCATKDVSCSVNFWWL